MRDYSAGVLGRDDLDAEFVKLERRAQRESPGAALVRSADLRYAGQSYELNVPWPVGKRFHQAHKAVYGYSMAGRTVEVVTIRVRATAATPAVRLAKQKATKSAPGPALQIGRAHV